MKRFHPLSRRWFALLLTVLTGVLTANGQRPMTMPAPLRPGDRVAVLSPSSSPKASTVEDGCRVLRQWGYEPVVGRHALADYHGFAGRADERAEDLLWALRDTTIRAIFCTRGGDGAVQLLPRIGLDELARHPKWVVGFSDVTALHSALVQAGVMSIHGSMCHALARDDGEDTVSVTLRRLLEGQLPVYRHPAHPLNQWGTGEGMLVGGNFSVFCGLAGSEFDFLTADVPLVLFFEDTDEAMTKIDRLLHLLEVRGVLRRLKGIVVGQFSGYKHPQNDFADMNEMLHEYLQHYDIPVCYDFPVGHARLKNFPMVEGCPVRLTVDEGGACLEFTNP